jgi:hypothetical protein
MKHHHPRQYEEPVMNPLQRAQADELTKKLKEESLKVIEKAR